MDSNSFLNKKCLIFGSGVSGKGAARLLLDCGAEVFLFDENEKTDREAVRASFKEEDRISVICGELPEEVKDSTELCVLSPGVPLENHYVTELEKSGIEIIGEIELACRIAEGDIIAITGTNGKTTTTTLVGEIMKDYAKSLPEKRDVLVVGNIGEPYTLHASETKENTVTVAEISSFQLETIVFFKPHISAVLNITPDHLNRHHTMENYAAMKERITENQDETDFLILNHDDPLTRSIAERTRAKTVFFTREEGGYGKDTEHDYVHIMDGAVFYNDRKIIALNEIRLLGSHNHENIMAAVGMAVSFGVPDHIIADTIRNFNAVEHRIEFVKTVDGADYYNDSKGTNPDASIKAVEAMVKPTVIIAGGYDKDSTYDEFIEAFPGKVKLMVLIGATAEKIKQCAEAHGFKEIVMAEDLKDAVRICHENAGEGEAVLLSPACASWGMFKNFEERGRLFKEYVNSL
ncbi:MAG: UDP-N-acetylmuramoyl-L-alanine--D-glutamate ligase [Lachnospiraceae bacterium]|nr:UDP-N-acetylmuramoyl-L-alanine--D-glutamate ligase [Lachnospiraceae bacterium]